MQFNEQKVQGHVGRMVGEFSTVASASLIALGDRLCLYKAMSEQGWMTSTEVAERAGLTERYVREWLAAQAASGFIRLDAAADKYQLENEMAMCFAVETSPAFIPGFCDCAEAMFHDLPKLEAYVPYGARRGLAPALSLAVQGHGAVLQTRLHCESRKRMDSRP